MQPTHKLHSSLVNLRKSIDLHGAKCVGLKLGRHCLGPRESYMEYWSEYATYLRRPHQVQQAAIDFFQSQFHAEEYAGVHWRYDTYDWNDMCAANRPDSAKTLNGKLCELSTRLENGDKELLKSMSANLHERLTSLSISHAYIAAPPQINDTIALFKE